jgi:hypothetical protein
MRYSHRCSGVQGHFPHARVLHDAAPKSCGWINTLWRPKRVPFRLNLKYNFIPGERLLSARAMAKPRKNRATVRPLEEQIRQRAFEIYMQRAGLDGSDKDDWQKAEAEFRSRDQET